MSKPTADTKWAASATKTEPSSGQKDAGWSLGQFPPAEWFNWWMDAVDQWKVWLAAFENTAHTWTQIQAFNSGITLGGAGITSGDLIVAAGKVTATAAAQTSVFYGLTVNHDLLVSGNLSNTGNLSVTGTGYFNSTLECLGLFTADAGIAIPLLTAPSLINSWANSGGGALSAGFWKDPFGVVHMQGLITGGASTSTAFVLPVGARPTATATYPSRYDITGKGANVAVDSSGNVKCYMQTGHDGIISLDGMSFRTT